MVPDFRRAAQTEKLIELLRSISIGQTLTYGTMAAVVGEDIQGSKRHYLISATRALEVEGIVFRTEINIGVRRLAAADLPAVGQQAIDRTRRSAKRGSRRLALIDRMNDASPETLTDVRAKRSLLGFLAWMASAPQRKRVEKEARQTSGPIPPAKLLDAFKR
jgi:hypothetical protein